MQKRRVRVCALVVLAATAGIGAPAHAFGKQSTKNLEDQLIVVEATPITHFERAHPERKRFGRLEWRGGLVLKSPSTFFGGWSGVAIDTDGDGILAISDTGVWITARVTYDGPRPSAVADARIGALRGADGKPLSRSRDRDSEGVVLLQGTLTQGEVLVSFERHHRVVRYPVSSAGPGPAAETLDLFPELRKLPDNKSLEAVCVVQAGPAKGSIAMFAERMLKTDGSHTGWLRPPLHPGARSGNAADAASSWKALSIQPIEGYDITDCAGAPDGGLFLLERRFRVSYGDPLTGSKMRIRHISQADLMSGATIIGETLIEANGQHEIDNMEGLAVHSDASGRTILTLISDDNFNSYLQRTVLLQFELVADPSTAERPK